MPFNAQDCYQLLDELQGGAVGHVTTVGQDVHADTLGATLNGALQVWGSVGRWRSGPEGQQTDSQDVLAGLAA